MHLDRLAIFTRAPEEDRAGLGRSAVAYGDDNAEWWRVWRGELVPTLAAVVAGDYAGMVEGFERERVEPSARGAAGAEPLDVLAELLGQVVEHAFAQHTAGGVMGAQDQYVGRHDVSVSNAVQQQEDADFTAMPIGLPRVVGAAATAAPAFGAQHAEALASAGAAAWNTGMLPSV